MRRSTIIGALLAGGLALTGCTPSERPSETPPGPGTPTPAAAAQPASTHPASATQHTSTDREFAEQLAEHQQQLGELAALAQQNGQSPKVRDLAGRIGTTQRSQLAEVGFWLNSTAGKESESAPEDTDVAEDLRDEGVADPQAVQKLRDTRGPAFDEQWKQVVAEMQDGAVEMAGTELEEGSAPQVRDLAGDVIDTHQSTLAELQQPG